MAPYAYQNIIASFVADIRGGTLNVGDRLPPTKALCERFGVSKITIRRAMDELAAQGLISRRRGAGTFVKALPMGRADQPRGWNAATERNGFAAQCASRGMVARAEVHSVTLEKPDRSVCQALALSTDEFCHRLTRTLFADDVACVYQHCYIPTQIVESFTARDGEQPLLPLLERETGLHVTSSYRTIVATHLDSSVAKLMSVPSTDPVLRINTTHYLENGRPVEYSINLHTPGYEFYSII